MNEKLKIKVIKKNTVKTPVKAVKQSKRAAAREIVSTVTNWVSDFQVRKSTETKSAIEKFFSQNPRPSEL
jgi:uncharacterized membrane-anchored protein